MCSGAMPDAGGNHRRPGKERIGRVRIPTRQNSGAAARGVYVNTPRRYAVLRRRQAALPLMSYSALLLMSYSAILGLPGT